MGEVVSSILLAADELLRVEKLAVGAGADLVDDRRLQVHEDAARDVLASAGLGEERVERIITATDSLVARHLPVRLNTVLKAEKLPATIPDLAAGLTHVDEDSLTHCSGVVLLATKWRKRKGVLRRDTRA